MSGPPPLDPPCVPYGTETVKVVAGAGGKTHTVIIHKNLLCAASKFFGVALERAYPEAQNQEIELLEEKDQTFSALTDWLYGWAPGTSIKNMGCAVEEWDLYWFKE